MKEKRKEMSGNWNEKKWEDMTRTWREIKRKRNENERIWIAWKGHENKIARKQKDIMKRERTTLMEIQRHARKM